MTLPKITETVTLRTAHIVRMLAGLVAKGLSHADLTAMTGLADDTVTRWLVELRRETPERSNLVHVETWRQDPRGCWTIPVYRWCPGAADEERPAPKTSAQRMRDRRARNRVETAPVVRTQWVGGRSPFASQGGAHA